MNKLIKILILCGILCAATTTAQAQGGTTGSLQWIFSNGTLTITGTGAMPDYANIDAQPWAEERDFITNVVIGNGITNIGIRAFQECISLTEVSIPNTVTIIGERAFGVCYSLPEITIPNSVTSIGYAAFTTCRSLAEVIIPESVIEIGYAAFTTCKSLTEVMIPKSVTEIGDQTFSYCDNLTAINVDEANEKYSSVDGVLFENQTRLKQYPAGKKGDKYTVPDGVTTISQIAFGGCSNLTEITIPNSVESITYVAFEDCSNLTAINVDDGNSKYFSMEGVLFEGTQILHTYPAGKQEIKYTIPNTVEIIMLGAFVGCNLTEITIPNSVKTIESYTFSSCSSLTDITIPNSVTSIGVNIFSYCTSLASVTVQWTNPPIISSDVFYYSGTNTVRLIVPPGSEYEYASAPVWEDFYIEGFTNHPLAGNCGDALTWNYDIDSYTLTISGTGDMDNYSNAEEVPWSNFRMKIKTLNFPDGMTSIGDYAFYYCESLKEAIIPNTVTAIGEWAFYYCRDLTEVIIPNSVTTIGFAAFRTCSSLTAVNIPNSVIAIGDWAFWDCSGLIEAIIPSSVATIGERAFFNCRSLAVVTNHADVPQLIDANVFQNVDISKITLRVPAASVAAYHAADVWNEFNIVGIGDPTCERIIASGYITEDMTWVLCDGGTLTISGTGDMPDYGFDSPWADVRDFIKKLIIDDGVTSIGNTAFNNCNSLIDVTIGNSLTTIGEQAFVACNSLTSVIIPNSVTTIKNYAFLACSGLTSVTIGNSVTTIGYGAFQSCSGLTSVTIPNSVTTIGSSAFQYCGLTEITIGNSVTIINVRDFLSFCASLTAIYVYEDNENYSSMDGVLFNKNQTTLVTYPFGKTDGYTIPNSVTTIEDSAFEGCYNLTSVTIPNSVTTIGSSAFQYCSSLTSVTIPNSVTTICDMAFGNCGILTAINVDEDNEDYSSLDGVLFNKNRTTLIQYPVGKQGGYAIPNSVTTIEDSAFEGCGSLTDIVIPASVVTFGYHAFIDSGLTEIINHSASPQDIDLNVFVTFNATLYVPAGSISAYRGDAVWGMFTNIIELGSIPSVITISAQPELFTELSECYITGDLSVAARATQDATLAYQWFMNTLPIEVGSSPIAGATGETLVIPSNLRVGAHYFYCMIFASNEATPVASEIATVNVTPDFIPALASPVANVIFGSISDALSVEMSCASEGLSYSYQWYSNSIASNTGGTTIYGATGASYSLPAALGLGTHYYYCLVNAAGVAGTKRTNVATVTVHEPANEYPVVNIAGTAELSYSGAPINLSTVAGLFTIDPNAGAPTYTLESDGSTGEGSIGVDAKTLTVTKAGIFKIGLTTAANGNYEPGAEVIATLTVNKAPGAPADVPTLLSRTSFSITLSSGATTNQTIEYARAATATPPSTGWQQSPLFSGLQINTSYYFFARTMENELYQQGAASEGIAYSTDNKIPVNNIAGAATITFSLEGIDLSELSELFTIALGAGARMYTVEAGSTGEGKIAADAKTLTVTKAGEIKIGLVTAEQGNYAAGAKVIATLTVNKAKGEDITDPPFAESVTYNSITIKEIPQATNGQKIEYTSSTVSRPLESSVWLESRTMTGLKSDTRYYIIARAKENDNYLAGAYLYNTARTALDLTGNGEIPEVNPLQAWFKNGVLQINGLTKGAVLAVYNTSGVLLYKGVAGGDTEEIPLSVQGVYIIHSDGNILKVTN